jgi:hypothetical protein
LLKLNDLKIIAVYLVSCVGELGSVDQPNITKEHLAAHVAGCKRVFRLPVKIPNSAFVVCEILDAILTNGIPDFHELIGDVSLFFFFFFCF